MKLVFAWTAREIEHIGKHAVSPEEAEHIIRTARKPFPQKRSDGKWVVWGQTSAGRYLQVIFVFPPDDQIDVDALELHDLLDYSGGNAKVARVIHAMDLDDEQKRRVRGR